MEKIYTDEISMICHKTAKALYKIGAITETEMHEYDLDCFVHEPKPIEEATVTY